NWVTGVFRRNWAGILAVVTAPFGGIIFWVAKHWSTTTGKFSGAWNWVTGVFRRNWAGILAVVTAPFGGMIWWVAKHWDTVKGKFSAAWNWVSTTFFGKWNQLKDKLHSPIQAAKDLISTTWDGIKATVAKPVNAVIRFINSPMISGLNSLLGWVGIKSKIGTLKTIPGYARGGWTGPGARLDPRGVVHADEFVVKKSSRRSLESAMPGALDYMNTHGAWPGLGTYAEGGHAALGGSSYVAGSFQQRLVKAAHALQAMGWRISEHPLFGGVHPVHMRGSDHYSGNAFDANKGGPGASPEERRDAPAAEAVLRSYDIGYLYGAKVGHADHIHAMPAGRPGDGSGLSATSIASGGFDPLGPIRSLLGGPLSKVASAIGSSPLARMLVGGVKTVGGKIVPALASMALRAAKTAKDFVTGGSSEEQSRSTVQRIVAGVARQRGWDYGAQWKALDALISQESSWNPRAQNSSSTAYGLFQFLDSTWRLFGARKTPDPMGQAQAGLAYIAKNYRDPVGAWAFHRAHNWYDTGGRVTEPSRRINVAKYDNGGVLRPGLSLNMTGRNERVRTHDQEERLVEALAGLVTQQASLEDLAALASRPLVATVQVHVDGKKVAETVNRVNAVDSVGGRAVPDQDIYGGASV
ncbi:transglycosylase SLT domain-containing protein, partial [Luteipulveratus sp. YIM 133132]|uniref:aggregation-promoting factor C-terminal-like domain-containing protein n=1 Tax=Luteipulveratus flavus TaxID=3031728 RepID=UPI0023B009F1